MRKKGEKYDTDSYYKISRAFLGGQPLGNLTRNHIVDNITLYWLTGTGASATREYWEAARAQARAASIQTATLRHVAMSGTS